MDSNDNERAQSGDTIEITTHLRNDLGKRMQVSTSDGLSVVAMDNRMRVTVAHGDYKVVKRCGRPATVEAPKKRGRPSNAEIAARAAAERTPPAVEVPKAKVDLKCTVKLDENGYVTGITAPVVTDADVAGLEAAIAKAEQPVEIDVPVTRKTAFDVMVERKREALNAPTEQDAREEQARALDDKADAFRGHVDRIAREASAIASDKIAFLTQEQIDAATESLRPLYGITQADFDEMTRQTEPRGFVGMDLASGPDVTVVSVQDRKHSHYFKDVSPFDVVDVYRVLSLFNVTDPCLQHAVKKLLVAGGRGHKDISKDVSEVIDALERWQDMRDEEAAA